MTRLELWEKYIFFKKRHFLNSIYYLNKTVELPIINPELFKRVGVKPPKVINKLIKQ